jgi:hypothetical protein
VVGVPLYSPDGSYLAFSAMPSDGSAGPDVYVWAVGDTSAKAITSDHDSWLSAWTGDGILVSRVTDGTPSAYRLDPASGDAVPIGGPGIWLPSVSPDGTSAAWWSGTVKLAADGITWVPDSGKLVLGPWSDAGAGVGAQTLARGPLDSWQVRWDEAGSVVAVWVDQVGSALGGQLSLYRVDATTNAPNLDAPILDAAPANPDFSLRTGRLAWTAPSDTAPQTVEVLAWAGKAIGRLELRADGSGAVLR